MSNLVLVLASLAGMLDPDGVIATAPSGQQAVVVGAVAPVAAATPSVTNQVLTTHDLTTDEQIDRWLAARAADDRPQFADGGDPWSMKDDRKVHGEVSVGVGTGDYSAYSASVSLPVGENGRVDLHYSQSKNDPWGYGYGYGRRLGAGYGDGYEGGRSQSFGVHYDSSGSRSGGRPFDGRGINDRRDRIAPQPSRAAEEPLPLLSQ